MVFNTNSEAVSTKPEDMDEQKPQFVCDICETQFSDAAHLRRHKRRKRPCAAILDVTGLTDEQKQNPNKCKFCGRVFARKDSLTRHLQRSCKIVPRNGDTSGMEKLYEHVLKKQEERHKADLESLRKEMEEKFHSLTTTEATPERGGKEFKTVNVVAKNAIVDQSTRIKQNININFFGSENTSHITPRDVLGLFRNLGPIRADTDLGKAGEKIILSMAMMIYSDQKHPENITCYLPSKKGKEALVHAEGGWEVMPVSLTLSPMASKSVDELFKKQPWPGIDGIAADANLDEPTKILSYIAKNEGQLVGDASSPNSELRAIPIRNKDILEKVLARLPKTGDE